MFFSGLSLVSLSLFSSTLAVASQLSFEEFEKQRKYLPLLQEITTHLGVELIDPSKLFCDDIKCRMIINHTIMFRDNDHLNIPGSKLVGKFISNNSLTLNNR